ncbi:SDR family oxidoreductase [Microbacterium sp. DT81.1]|uniref:SDR family oxidoreductase n=1 Tax=Microbacterium sp. DT81.1 TaxID=3393413 RepID=UPI003CF845CF
MPDADTSNTLTDSSRRGDAPALARAGDAALRGQHIVVTGATGGIGQSLVARLTAAGATVAATGSSPERLEQLRATSPHALVHAADITSEDEVEGFYAAVHEAGGPVDAVVNLAGLSIPGAVAETSVEDFHALISVNVLGTFLSCKHALPRLRETDAQIINVGSLAGTRPNATAPLYCTAKAAVAMFTDAFALQVKDRRVRMTNLTPGGTDTAFWGDRPVNRDALMASDDVVDTIIFVLTRPKHVVVLDVRFESTGRPRD